MRRVGVILYGPPASGKDTVTRALVQDGGFTHHAILKAGPGRTEGYTMTTREDIDSRRTLWRVERYGATYAVDANALLEATTSGTLPVVHCGSVERVNAIMTAGLGEWLTVALWCPRDVTARRLHERDATTVGARLKVWDSTPRAWLDLVIDTGRVSATGAADAIRAAATA